MGYLFPAAIDPRIDSLDAFFIDTSGLFPRSKNRYGRFHDIMGEEIEERSKSCGIAPDFIAAVNEHLNEYERVVFEGIKSGRLLIPTRQHEELQGIRKKVFDRLSALPTKDKRKVAHLYERQAAILQAVWEAPHLRTPETDEENDGYLNLALDWLDEDPAAAWNRIRDCTRPGERDISFARQFMQASGNGVSVGFVSTDRGLAHLCETAYTMRRDARYRTEEVPVLKGLYSKEAVMSRKH